MTGLIGVITALLSTLSWAIGVILLKKINDKASPIAMTLLKSIYSAILLSIIILITKENFILSSKDIIPIILSGILGIAIGDSFFFASLKYLSPIVLSVILLACPDIVTGVLSFFILKELPSLITWAGIFLILGGLYYLIFPIKNDSEKTKSDIKGYVFIIISLLCTALSMVMVKPTLNNVPTITVTFYRLLTGGSILLIFSLYNKEFINHIKPLKDKDFRNIFFPTISIIAIGGFWLSILAIKHIELITASTLMALEPLFITLIMIVFNKYTPSKKEIIGVILTILGISLVSFGAS